MRKQDDGFYPVRVLRDKVLKCFVDFSNQEELESEVKYNGLNPKLKYRVSDGRIKDCAEIKCTDQSQIILNENFCQFVWSLSYSILVLFDEVLVRPIIEKEEQPNDKLIETAIKSMDAALKLLVEPKRYKFYELPNPENDACRDDFYVNKTEGVYCMGISFVLFHELGHSYLGHTTYDPESSQQSIKEEEDADSYAFDVLSGHFEGEYGDTIKVGIVIGLISQIFLDGTLSGGGTHPDPHQRVKTIFEKMNLSDNHNLWAVSAIAFKLWSIKYNKKLDFPESFISYRELFDKTYMEFDFLKENFV